MSALTGTGAPRALNQLARDQLQAELDARDLADLPMGGA